MSSDKEQNANRAIATKLDEVDAAFRHGMIPTSFDDLAELSGEAVGSSLGWGQWLFKPDAAPYGGDRSQQSLSYCVGIPGTVERTGTSDLVRYEYVYRGNPVIVIESPQFTLTLLPGTGGALKAMDPPTRLRALAKLAEQIFLPWVPEKGWQARSPSTADDGVAFTTDPDNAPFDIRWWDQRMDAGVWQGHTYFFFYRRMKTKRYGGNPIFFRHLRDGTP